jgi:hypothetical protein
VLDGSDPALRCSVLHPCRETAFRTERIPGGIKIGKASKAMVLIGLFPEANIERFIRQLADKTPAILRNCTAIQRHVIQHLL